MSYLGTPLADGNCQHDTSSQPSGPARACRARSSPRRDAAPHVPTLWAVTHDDPFLPDFGPIVRLPASDRPTRRSVVVDAVTLQ
jgi:hypothetical protein